MGTLSKGTGAVAGISQRQGRYKRSAPAFLIILAALVLLLGYSMIPVSYTHLTLPTT